MDKPNRKLKIGYSINIADGKSAGGRGRLTDIEINKLQSYYGNATRGDANNLVGIRYSMWAIIFSQALH